MAPNRATFILLAIAACSSSPGRTEQPTPSNTAVAPARPEPVAPTKVPPKLDHFGLLPADGDGVVSISLRNLRSDPLWAEFAAALKKKGGGEGVLAGMNECSLSLLDRIDTVAFSVDSSAASARPYVVVDGLSRVESEQCFSDGDGATLLRDGVFTRIEREGAPHTLVGWAGPRTMLIRQKGDKSAMRERLAGRDSLRSNRELFDMVSYMDPRAGLLFALQLRPGSDGKVMTQSLFPDQELVGLFGSATLEGELFLKLWLRFEHGDEAAAALPIVEALLDSQHTMLGPIGESIAAAQLAVEDTDLRISLTLPEAQIKSLAAMFTVI
jgi:hypothetical protein